MSTDLLEATRLVHDSRGSLLLSNREILLQVFYKGRFSSVCRPLGEPTVRRTSVRQPGRITTTYTSDDSLTATICLG